ncbi:HNH endonuclease [Sphingopyxis sp. J-6]|uniref:HNH endonuclease n=1 Tax=Sphingopyxis sp. J-6 TaxID=3122054 RepID=UPI003984200C
MPGVFAHRRDTHYADEPYRQYQFPKSYLSRARQFAGDWVIYYEPVKPRGRGFFAVAWLEKIVADPTREGHYLALIKPDTYLDFAHSVPRMIDGGLVESDLANAQAAVRPLSQRDFVRIINLGLGDDEGILPRVGDLPAPLVPALHDTQRPFRFEQERVRAERLTSRIVRDRVFRTAVLAAYDERCAMTGLKFINGGGRAEVAAAHIRPVATNGPDSVNNGLALSGTAHWMFDRGLISLDDDLSVLISRQVNDVESLDRLLRPDRKAIEPLDPALRPHPSFLAWHREHIFKH